MLNNLIISLLLVTLGQILAYFQLQGQFMSIFVKNNPLLTSFLGIPISYLLIKFTEYSSKSFGGEVWPGRLIGFSVGAIVFATLSYFIMKEPITTKTMICLALAFLILLVQIFFE